MFLVAVLLGSLTTGLAVFLTAWVGRLLLESFEMLVTIGAGVVSALTVGSLLGVPVILSRSWMVPKHWAVNNPVGFSALFGYSLGLGWRTQVGSNLWWLLVLISALQPNLWLAAAPIVVFGLTRALPVVVIALTRSTVTRGYATSLTVKDSRILRAMATSSSAQTVEACMLLALGAYFVTSTPWQP